MFLPQRTYCKGSLNHFGMEMARTASTSIVGNMKLSFLKPVSGDVEWKAWKAFPCKSMIGSLLYVSTHNEPNITFSEGILCRFVESPTTALCVAIKSMLCYLQGAQGTGVPTVADISGSKMQNGNFARLSTYIHSDWAWDIGTSKSTGGYMIQVNGGLVSWRTFKQCCVAAPSTEAKYIPLVECIQKGRHLHDISRELGEFHEPSIIYEENHSRILWATAYGMWNKHVDVHKHICHEAGLSVAVEVGHCPSAEMIADRWLKPTRTTEHLLT